MKLQSAAVQLFQVDGRTDMTTLIDCFRNFVTAPNTTTAKSDSEIAPHSESVALLVCSPRGARLRDDTEDIPACSTDRLLTRSQQARAVRRETAKVSEPRRPWLAERWAGGRLGIS